jgi:hypothetical protein
VSGREALQLFHQVAHRPSAQVRRYVVDYGLAKHILFRNIAYPEVAADFHARGGKTLPALWDGVDLFEGAEASIARLSQLVDLGRERSISRPVRLGPQSPNL